MKASDLLSTSQGAQYLGITAKTLRRHVELGHIKPALDMNGRGYWFKRRDLDKLKAEHSFETGRPKARA